MDDLVGGEILDPNDQVLAQRTEFLRQLPKRLGCNGLELVERRFRSEMPTGRSGKWSGGHGASFDGQPGIHRRIAVWRQAHPALGVGRKPGRAPTVHLASVRLVSGWSASERTETEISQIARLN